MRLHGEVCSAIHIGFPQPEIAQCSRRSDLLGESDKCLTVHKRGNGAAGYKRPNLLMQLLKFQDDGGPDRRRS